jgi:ribonuclease-3
MPIVEKRIAGGGEKKANDGIDSATTSDSEYDDIALLHANDETYVPRESAKNMFNDDEYLERTEDGYVFNPYNLNNREITADEIQTILSKYGIPSKIFNIELYKRAFVHKSYTKRPQLANMRDKVTIVERPENAMTLKTKSNERLEFVGDGVLECITKYYLYRRFPKENEGFMTEKKIAIVKNESIGKLALELGLHKWFIISRHSEEKKTRTNLKKLGCLFEAFLGALFLDFNKITVHDEHAWFERTFVCGPGFQMAQIFVENVFERHIDWMNLIKNDDNYKNILQVKVQKEFKVTPDYIELCVDAENGYRMGVFLCVGQPIHEVSFENAIPFEHFGSFSAIQNAIEQNGGKIFVFFSESTHKIKRKAEQRACKIIIDILEAASSQ